MFFWSSNRNRTPTKDSPNDHVTKSAHNVCVCDQSYPIIKLTIHRQHPSTGKWESYIENVLAGLEVTSKPNELDSSESHGIFSSCFSTYPSINNCGLMRSSRWSLKWKKEINWFTEGSTHHAAIDGLVLRRACTYAGHAIAAPLGVAMEDTDKEFSQREEFQVVHMVIHFLWNGTWLVV